MKKNELISLLESLGYIIPTDQQSVTNFENSYRKEIESIKPKDWDNPLAIIQRGFINRIDVSIDLFENINMAQAAREGKQITNEMKNKMMQDRRKANE